GVPLSGELEVHGLDFAALAANSARFASLASYPLQTNLSAQFVLGPGGQLESASFVADGAGSVSPPGLGRAYQVDSFALEGSFEAEGQRLNFTCALIDRAGCAGFEKGTVAFGFEESGVLSVGLDLEAEDVRLNLPDIFAEEILLSSADVSAQFDGATRSVRWDR